MKGENQWFVVRPQFEWAAFEPRAEVFVGCLYKTSVKLLNLENYNFKEINMASESDHYISPPKISCKYEI